MVPHDSDPRWGIPGLNQVKSGGEGFGGDWCQRVDVAGVAMSFLWQSLEDMT